MRAAMLAEQETVLAPDGSEIHEMLALAGGSMVHCTLPPGGASKAVRHRTVEELWYVVGGAGRMWRRAPSGDEEVVTLTVGTCLSIPVGTAFQFRADGDAPHAAVGVTMPPWPGPDEATPTDGPWPATPPPPPPPNP